MSEPKYTPEQFAALSPEEQERAVAEQVILVFLDAFEASLAKQLAAQAEVLRVRRANGEMSVNE